ncbi:MAG: hypothetical protein RMJ15_06470 [Nitrososphaerota archaeon]|nr:hypothetical protein [Candidatus Bathyarchaeota archaeon]MDW8023363.1 hypothetical protein [Nitrososphaerota archaeon]
MNGNAKWAFVAAALTFTFTLILAPVCQSNPIPVNYRVKMSEEDIKIYVYPSMALVEGIYTFEMMWGEPASEVHMFYPLPSNAEKIKVAYIKGDEQRDVHWKRSSLAYETAIGNYSVIEWTLSESPALAFPFRILVRYEYEIPRQNDVYFMLYAMGSIKLTDQLNMPNLVYSKGCRVSLNTYFPNKPEDFDAYLVGLLMVDDVPVPDGKWSIKEGKMDVSRHESKWVGDKFLISTELRLNLLTMRCDYAIQFKAAERKFAWIETLSTDKNAYKPGENVTLEVAVRRGNDMLAVVYEAEVRYTLIVDGEEMGFLGSSRIEIPSANGRDTARYTFQLPDKLNRSMETVLSAELWSWNNSLEDTKEVLLEILENGDGNPPQTEQSPMWVSAAIATAATSAVIAIAIISILYRGKFRRR